MKDRDPLRGLAAGAVVMPLADGTIHEVTVRDLRRFWAKVESDPSGCWLWTAKVNRFGYGDFGLRTYLVKAHRFAYTVTRGPIPDGLVLDHLCRVRHCVNPAHLEPVTQRVNTLRGDGLAAQRARRTACPQGHPYDAQNTYLSRAGERHCRTCHRLREQARKATARATEEEAK